MKPNVLVLGATGFIGRNLVRYLMDNQCANCIRCVDKVFPQTAFLSPQHAEVYNYPNLCQFMQGNLTSAQSIAKCFDLPGGKFNFVFNCAAETKYGQDESIYVEKTQQLAVKVAQEAAKRGTEKFIHLSNAQVYEEGKKPSKEDAKCSPWTALAAVQLKTEEELKKITGLNLIILRPSMVYGPGDTTGLAPRVICAAVYKKLDEKMKFMWSGDLKLHTVHVYDVAAAMWHCAMNVPAGSIFNVSDKNDTDQEKINKVLEAIFHISTGFVGSIMSNLAKVNFKGVTEEVNDKHMKPWSELCKEAGIANTPLTPYLDSELLYNNSLSVDGGAIEKAGFVYRYPNLTKELVLETIMYHAQQNLFPFKA